MSNDYDSAVWAEFHGHVTAELTRLFEKIAVVFETLHAIEYDAPWERRAG